MTQTQIVVGAAIIRDGALLAAQRAHPEPLRGRWELPGGKVDSGESEEAALTRECGEELGVGIRPLTRIVREVRLPQRADDKRALLRVWIAELVEGDPEPLEHLALRWLTADTLTEVDWLPADLPFLDDIRPYLKPSGPALGG